MIFQNAHCSLFLFGFDRKTGRETARIALVDQQPQIKIEESHTGLRPTSSHEQQMTKVEVVFRAVTFGNLCRGPQPGGRVARYIIPRKAIFQLNLPTPAEHLRQPSRLPHDSVDGFWISHKSQARALSKMKCPKLIFSRLVEVF